MGIEIQAFSDGVHPGQLATFTFQEHIQAYTLGMSGFSLSYGRDDDHWVQRISIALLPVQTSPNTVSVQVDARLQDAQGSALNPEWSRIYPVCVAVTGTPDSNTVLTNTRGIANGSTAQISLTGPSDYSVVESFLAGFDLAFSEQQTQFLGANAGCAITYNQSEGTITGSADLYDDSDNHVNAATVDVGVMASMDDAVFEIQEVSGEGSGIEVAFSKLSSISQVCCLIRSWQVRYPGTSDHNLLWIGAGAFDTQGASRVEISGNTVTIPNLSAGVMDGGNDPDTQDEASSYCTVLVIALP